MKANLTFDSVAACMGKACRLHAEHHCIELRCSAKFVDSMLIGSWAPCTPKRRLLETGSLAGIYYCDLPDWMRTSRVA